MTLAVCLNGQHGTPDSLRVSVLDRGFLYGDGAFEVVRTYGGVPFALEEHLGRLLGSLRRLGISAPVPLSTMLRECVETLQRAGNAESYLRITVTRGEVSRPGLDLAGENPVPTRVIVASPLRPIPIERYRQGVRATVVRMPWVRASASAPSLAAWKTLNYLPQLLALQEAKQRGYDEAVLVGHADAVFECASANVFVVSEGALHTPPVEDGALAGITRGFVLEAARAARLTVREEAMALSDLWTADEVFVTATLREVMPVTWLDEHEVGEGRSGPVTRRVLGLFRALTPTPTATLPF